MAITDIIRKTIAASLVALPLSCGGDGSSSGSTIGCTSDSECATGRWCYEGSCKSPEDACPVNYDLVSDNFRKGFRIEDFTQAPVFGGNTFHHINVDVCGDNNVDIVGYTSSSSSPECLERAWLSPNGNYISIPANKSPYGIDLEIISCGSRKLSEAEDLLMYWNNRNSSARLSKDNSNSYDNSRSCDP